MIKLVGCSWTNQLSLIRMISEEAELFVIPLRSAGSGRHLYLAFRVPPSHLPVYHSTERSISQFVCPPNGRLT